MGEHSVRAEGHRELNPDGHVCASFLDTGQSLCAKMKYRQAMSCYKSALNLIREKNLYTKGENGPSVTLDEITTDVFFYCEVLSRAVDLCLHLKAKDCAKDLLTEFEFKAVFDTSNFDPRNIDKVNDTLGDILLKLGVAFVADQCISSAKELLEQAEGYITQFHSCEALTKIAELNGLLGFCNLVSGNLTVADDKLLDSVEQWRKLNYPLYKIDLCIDAMKHYIECKLMQQSPNVDEHNVCTDMLRLHKALWKRGLQTHVPKAFNDLGMVAFQQEKEKTSLAFFEEALALYQQMPCGVNRDDIMKLLRNVGVASYNCRDYHKAAKAYKECLDMLKQNHASSRSNLSQIAECCAALGFTYSRLRNFDMVLEYYEKALELHNTLPLDDLELIETNVGSLYHVKAVLYKREGDVVNSRKYFDMAEGSFTKALKYSWKSFPFINYGYYLLCRQKYLHATHVLQQGYLNGVVDKDTVEFDHTEDPILIEDLKRELEGCEDIRMPSTVIALYLKAICLHRLRDPTAHVTARQLQHEVRVCRFESYYTEGFGLERMQALCNSLVGYVFKMMGQKAEARACFQHALDVMSDYPTAVDNIKSLSVL